MGANQTTGCFTAKETMKKKQKDNLYNGRKYLEMR